MFTSCHCPTSNPNKGLGLAGPGAQDSAQQKLGERRELALQSPLFCKKGSWEARMSDLPLQTRLSRTWRVGGRPDSLGRVRGPASKCQHQAGAGTDLVFSE